MTADDRPAVGDWTNAGPPNVANPAATVVTHKSLIGEEERLRQALAAAEAREADLRAGLKVRADAATMVLNRVERVRVERVRGASDWLASLRQTIDALAALAASPAPVVPDAAPPFWRDLTTGEPCPRDGAVLCTVTNPDHLHRAIHMDAPVVPDSPDLRIDSGWLVEVHDECTIGCEPQYGHQPGCGLIPLQRLDDLPGWPLAVVHPTATVKGWPAYSRGDADPTRDTDGDVICAAESPEGYGCTWPSGHEHPQHVAGDGVGVCAAWPTGS